VSIDVAGNETEVTGVGIGRCPRCGEAHEFRFGRGLPKQKTIYLPCPRVTRFWRLSSFYIDSTPNVLDEAQLLAQVEHIHGAMNLEQKLARWREVRRPGLWLIFEYREMAEEVLQAYIQGLSYPALTGACCLAERVMNRLVFGLREHYRRSVHYKRIYKKPREQNWTRLRKILRDWRVLSREQCEAIKRLHALRTDAVHYVADYDYSAAAEEAVKLTVGLVDSLFFVFDRKDIFRIFEVPGEIWVRADQENTPFVQEFVLPLCGRFGPTHLWLDAGHYEEDGAPIEALSEEEFIEFRRRFLKKPDDYKDGKTPAKFTIDFNDGPRVFVVP